MRQRRRQLTRHQQKTSALALARLIRKHPLFIRSPRIALYLPSDGEIDPTRLIQEIEACGKQCYLPVLHPVLKRQLWFARFEHNSHLQNNRFGIPEPSIRRSHRAAPWSLSLILLPLVAFDRQGGRLGMGGGFYDKTFAFTKSSRKGPLLVGLAHGFQEQDALEKEPWDVPLHGIATEKEVLVF